MWSPEFQRKIIETAKNIKAGNGVSLNEYLFAKEINRIRGLMLQARLIVCEGDAPDTAISLLDEALGAVTRPGYGEQGDE